MCHIDITRIYIFKYNSSTQSTSKLLPNLATIMSKIRWSCGD